MLEKLIIYTAVAGITAESIIQKKEEAHDHNDHYYECINEIKDIYDTTGTTMNANFIYGEAKLATKE
jgi:hypothetical protein